MRKYHRLINLGTALLLAAIPLCTLVRVAQADPAPLAAYAFDRKSAPNFFDESGNGNDCTVSDTTHVKILTGHTNGAINSSSSSAYASCTNRDLQPASALTVMAWVQNTGGGGYQSALVNMPYNATTDDWGLYGGTWTEGFGGGIVTTGGSAWLPSGVSQSGANWHHLALTYDGTTAKFYVDGALTASQALTGTIAYSGTFPLQLYEDMEGDAHFQSSIDDLRIYGSALSQAQVQSLMNTPVSTPGITSQYARSITMSSSAISATSVTYSVSFTADMSYSLSSLIVDFCSNSPLAGESCTKPTGFTMGSPPTVSGFTIGGTPISGWTASSLNSGRTLVYTGSSGTNVTPGTVITFNITSITNPNSASSYFARILTYSFASPTYSATGSDNFKENGGVALSTAGGSNLSFQVPESLTFCVYKSSCGDNPTAVLGHGSGDALDSTAVDTDSVQLSASTNAQYGIVVNMKGSTLTSGSNQIPPVDGGSGNTNTSITPGTAAFGMDIPSADADFLVNYCYQGDGTATGYYCLYDQGTSAGIRSAYGTEIISSTGPLSNALATLTFAATASTTTPAGYYTTSFSLIATATF